ncbi:hypothetical protein ACIRL3_18595 [Streptomyces sp. NPDC102384]|uniref:hypothetical protein n=1 Tax=Streptomyces sp. NPDC102384 TaxID=3366166 RepID=UPI0037F8EDCC
MAKARWWRLRKVRIDTLCLRSVDRTVGVEAVLRLPSVMVLAVEDACTCFAYDDWNRRRPPLSQPWVRRRWQAEGKLLSAKVARLMELAAQCLDGAE